MAQPEGAGLRQAGRFPPIALGQLDMKLLTGPLTQCITEVLTRHGVVSDWQQRALPGSNTPPSLFMGQRQLQRGRPNYGFSFDDRKAFDTASHGALHLILRPLSVPPEVIDLLLFLHTCARLRIVTAHGLTQPVHMLRGVRQGNTESPHLYALLLEPLIRAQGHRLRPPGEAKRGLIRAYVDDLLVVAHTLQHFVEGVEVVAAYLRTMGMDLNARKCAMATTERVPGLQLRLCPHLENPWHWVPAADSVPYLGPQLQPDKEFSLQRKHRLRLAAVHRWCLNTLSPPNVVQYVILAILWGVTQYVAAFMAHDSNTAGHLDHITVQVAKGQAVVRFQRLTRQPARRLEPGAYAGANAVPAGGGGPRGHACRPPLGLRARRGHQDVPGSRRRTQHLPRGTLPRPGARNPGGGQLGQPCTPGPGCSGGGALQPHHVPQGSPHPAVVPPGLRRHAAHRQAATPRHVLPDGATHDAMAQAPRAAPPLPRLRQPVASSCAGVPQPVRQRAPPLPPPRTGAHRPPWVAQRPGEPAPHHRHAGPPPEARAPQEG